jgi:hypothetical protein
MTRRTRAGIGAAAAVAAILVLVASGCGGGSKKSSSETTTSATTSSSGGGTVSATDWANGFCSAVSAWGKSIRSVGPALQGNPSRSAVHGAVATIKNANQTLVASLKSLGAPDVQGGSRVKSAIDSLATTLRTHADTINSALASVGSAQELQAAVQTLATNLSAMGTAFRSTLNQLQSINKQSAGSLKNSIDHASACKKLNQANGG